MHIKELIDQIDALIGTSLTVNGRLVVAGTGLSYLTSCIEGFDRRESLLILDNGNIAAHLLSTLPPYGGGPFIYDEECIITGIVQRGADSPELHNFRRCRVRRNDLEIEVPVDGPSAPAQNTQ